MQQISWHWFIKLLACILIRAQLIFSSLHIYCRALQMFHPSIMRGRSCLWDELTLAFTSETLLPYISFMFTFSHTTNGAISLDFLPVPTLLGKCRSPQRSFPSNGKWLRCTKSPFPLLMGYISTHLQDRIPVRYQCCLFQKRQLCMAHCVDLKGRTTIRHTCMYVDITYGAKASRYKQNRDKWVWWAFSSFLFDDHRHNQAQLGATSKREAEYTIRAEYRISRWSQGELL